MSRELPHSLEAEQAILGAMLVYPSVSSVVYDQGLQASDFFANSHQIIFQAMIDISAQQKPIDATTLVTRLQDKTQLNAIGGADYIVQLSDSAISSANSVHYINMIKTRAHMRRLIEAAKKIAEESYDTSIDFDQVMDQAEQGILNVTRSRKASEFKTSREIVTQVIKELDILRKSDNRITGIKTGYVDLDRYTNGFQRGDLIILAARPSMGKTALALNLALHAAVYNPQAIAIFSLEMPAEALMKRILSAKSSVEGNKLRSGLINDREFNKLNEAANELVNTKMFVDDSSTIRVSEIFSKCRKLKSEQGLDMIVIDYLQLLQGSGKGGENRQQEISEISRSLKALAREMDCPVIALSQLTRGVESRPDKHPMLSDLRESGAIEQDADLVIFLYREAYYNKEEENVPESDTDTTDIDIAKHRNGATGRIVLAFQKAISAFYNVERSE